MSTTIKNSGTTRMRFSFVRTLLCGALVYSGGGLAEEAATLDLYMDSKTKQIFAEPGPGRVRMGSFKPVGMEAQTPAPSEEMLAAQRDVVMAEVEKRVDEKLKAKSDADAEERKHSKTKWAENFHLRGYVQTRSSHIIGGDEGINLWSDRSVGDDNSLGDSDKNFLIRRARLIFFGDVGDHMSFYVQPDFASSVSGSNNIAQLRDAYTDAYIDKGRVHRFRVGQSKVPYGFENLQSSQNRLAPDRADALNSGVRDERDLGVFYYYTPTHVQKLFKDIQDAGLKHSGNYGMFGLGIYNGQGANRGDENDNYHVVSRLTYPFKAVGQTFELGVQGYFGNYVRSASAYRSAANTSLTPTIDKKYRRGFDDERVGITGVWYPEPFGLQAEWNWGRTPGLDLADNAIEQKSLNGGYVQAMYMLKTARFGTMIPFVKWQYFDGYNKAENNAPRNKVNDWEIGLEWQFVPQLELTAEYHMLDRNNLVTGNRAGRTDYANFNTDVLRFQLQYNF